MYELNRMIGNKHDLAKAVGSQLAKRNTTADGNPLLWFSLIHVFHPFGFLPLKLMWYVGECLTFGFVSPCVCGGASLTWFYV